MFGGVRELLEKVGIPRGLFYYKFIPLWETFLNELGYEVVVSDQTNKRILDDGVKICVDEACLPVKLFHGHVMNLKDRVDYILIPRFTSISRGEYICPEFGGLPDMVRHTVSGLPKIIDAEVNMRKSDKGAIKAAIEVAAVLGRDSKAAKKAFEKALIRLNYFNRQFLNGRIPFLEENSRTVPQNKNSRTVPLSAGVIGHPYNVYDRHVSMNLLGKLKACGIEPVTVEMVGEREINTWASTLRKPAFWNFGRKAYGAALHMAASGLVDGMILVTSFGCGIDSFVLYLVERAIKEKYDIPIITMTLDEHSGEAGFNTRLEAFVDMLGWRTADENYFSALR